MIATLPDQTAWTLGPSQPTLPAGELHVWRAHLGQGLATEYPHRPADPVEQDDTLRVEARCFQRDIEARYARISGWDGNFQHLGEDRIPGIHITTAQCEDVALVAVSRAVREMGLDIERVREDIPFEEMAESFLDPRDQWDLRITWSKQEKAWKFFQFWTSNEACSQVRTPSAPAEARTFRLRQYCSNQDFIAALAVNGGPEPHVRFWDWLA